jgi:hypothetical protein
MLLTLYALTTGLSCRAPQSLCTNAYRQFYVKGLTHHFNHCQSFAKTLSGTVKGSLAAQLLVTSAQLCTVTGLLSQGFLNFVY